MSIQIGTVYEGVQDDTHSGPRRLQTRIELINFPEDEEREGEDWIDEKTLFHAVGSVIVETTAKDRDTCKTRAKEKESRSVRLALRVCLVSDGFEVEFPPLARTLVSEGTPHTRVVWAKSARPVLAVSCSRSWIRGESRRPICFVTANAPLCLSFSLPLSAHYARLSFPLTLSLPFASVFFVFSIALPRRSTTLASSSSSPSASPHLSSLFVHRIQPSRRIPTGDVTAGAGLVFESAAPIIQGETSLGSPTWGFKVDDGTSLAERTSWQPVTPTFSRNSFAFRVLFLRFRTLKSRTNGGHHV